MQKTWDSIDTADDLKKKNAVPCNLDFEKTTNCYFGMGIYADGICEEDIGVIVPSMGKVIMPSGEPGEKLSTCSVYIVLTQQ